MPSNRIKPSKNQINLAPPHLVPRISKFILEDLNSKNLPTSPIQNDDIITFWNYTLIKLGEKFELNHFHGPNNISHPYNEEFFIVVSKTKWCVVAYCESDETIILKIPAKSIRFLEEVQDSTEIDFEVGDYCYIKSAYYRSPYKKNKLFRIESTINNYVTVDPDTGPNVPILKPENLIGFDITMQKLKIKTRGWKQKIPFSELEILKHMPGGADLNELFRLSYFYGIY